MHSPLIFLISFGFLATSVVFQKVTAQTGTDTLQAGGESYAGGTPRLVDSGTQQLANQVLGAVQTALGYRLSQYSVINYVTQQNTNGVSYFMKMFIKQDGTGPTGNGGQYAHVRVLRSPNGEAALRGLELNRNANDPISYIYMRQC